MTRGESIQELIDKCETKSKIFFFRIQLDLNNPVFLLRFPINHSMYDFYKNAKEHLENKLLNMTIAEAEERTV